VEVNMAVESEYIQRDGQGYAKVTQAAEGAIKASSVTIGTTLTALPATALTNRRRLYIKNLGAIAFYIDVITTPPALGYPVRANEEVVIDVAGVTISAIVASGSGTAKVLEIA
jgi:hypothetical protein